MDQAFRDHLKRGDRKAAGTWLVRHHAPEVRGLCCAMAGSEGEDLAQDVFIKAFAGLPEFRGEASARTWILAIARNRCLDHLRRLQRAPVELDDQVDLEGPIDDSPLPSWMVQNRDAVRRALDVLGEVPRAMIQLRFVHGLDYGELGEVFGIRSGTARMRVSRALARMRLEFAPPMEAVCLCAESEEAPVGGAPAAAPVSVQHSRRAYRPPPLPDFAGVLQELSGSSGDFEASLIGLASMGR